MIDQLVGHSDIVLKYVDTARDVGRKSRAQMPMTATAGEIYRVLVALGFGKSDFDVLDLTYGGQQTGDR